MIYYDRYIYDECHLTAEINFDFAMRRSIMNLGVNHRRVNELEAELSKTRAGRRELEKAIVEGGANVEHLKRNLKALESYRVKLKDQLTIFYLQRIDLM